MKFLYLADTHIKGKNPENRIGDYYKDVMGKIQEVVSLSQKHKVDFVLHGGDVFNSPNVSNIIVDDFIDMIEKSEILWYIIWGNHDCFSLDTRLLTINGYKYYNEVKKGDLIPTVNLETKKIEYNPIEKIIFNISDKSYIIKTKTIEGEFSENHRHYTINDKAKTPKSRDFHLKYNWKIKTSKELLKYQTITIPTTFSSSNENYNISDRWLELFAWIHTDGYISKQGNIRIYQSKENNIKEIKELCNNLHLKYTERIRNRNILSICGKKLKSILPQHEIYFPMETSKKIQKILKLNKIKMAKWLYKLSDNQMLKLSKYLIKGDGSYTSSGTIQLWGMKKILDIWLGLFVTHNIDCSVIKDKRNSYYLCIHIRKINKMASRTIKNKQQNVLDKKSLMWDVTVKNHIIFVEKNGKAFITGNCVGHNPELSKASSLAHIFRRSKYIKHLESYVLKAYKQEGIDTILQGFDYYHNVEGDIKEKGLMCQYPDAKYKIAATHAFITLKPFLKHVLHIQMKDIKTDFDIVLCSHYHKDWGIKEINGTQFVNLGAIGRQGIDEVSRTPQVLLMDTDTKDLRIIKLESVKEGKEVFNLEKIKKIKDFEKNIDNFINGLQNIKLQSLDIRGKIEEIGEKTNEDKEVIKEVIKRIGQYET